MSLTPYQLGCAFEYRCRDYLRAAGWLVVRAAQSRGAIDLVALKPGAVLLIQCKRGGAFGVDEWNRFYRLARDVGARPILAEQGKPRGIVWWKLTGARERRKPRPRAAYDPA